MQNLIKLDKAPSHRRYRTASLVRPKPDKQQVSTPANRPGGPVLLSWRPLFGFAPDQAVKANSKNCALVPNTDFIYCSRAE